MQRSLKKHSKSGANRDTFPKGKARDPLEITGLFGLREPDLHWRPSGFEPDEVVPQVQEDSSAATSLMQ